MQTPVIQADFHRPRITLVIQPLRHFFIAPTRVRASFAFLT
jgi:hypothetical protein